MVTIRVSWGLLPFLGAAVQSLLSSAAGFDAGCHTGDRPANPGTPTFPCRSFSKDEVLEDSP